MKTDSTWLLRLSDLPLGPGGHYETTRTGKAPAGLGDSVLGVPPEADISVDISLDSANEGVLVSLNGEVPLRGACVRCLNELSTELEIEARELYFYPARKAELVSQGDEDIVDAPEITGDQIDLEALLRDWIIPELPYQPLCDIECAGLCPGCGEKIAELPPEHRHDVVDPRWSALNKLLHDEGKPKDANK